ncbi:MAG: hypothetical protein RMJ43_10690 [Chloroherpetonaceae bacterium]|nr:hypothetical protein [Chthonomonadaceae bacterium]MDW8208297.1 hypothetical protein [Chloroherpetonaceae bacterium]
MRRQKLLVGDTQFLLLLHHVPALGEKGISQLLHCMARMRVKPGQWLELPAQEWQRLYGLGRKVASYIAENRESLLRQSADALRQLQQRSVEVLWHGGRAYPQRLVRYEELPPPILYVMGHRALLSSEGYRFTFTVAVSNDAPEAVLQQQDRIAADLMDLGGIPVTSQDRLPYQRLALAAQRRNAPAVYVLDRGLREALGPELNRPLFAAARIREVRFREDRDAVFSPFRLDDHCIGAHNRRRDSLVFSLSDLVIALHVRPGGTMARECSRAEGQNKPVLYLNGLSGNALLREWSRGMAEEWACQVRNHSGAGPDAENVAGG